VHAVEAAGAVLGDLTGRRVLLIGAGRIAARAARALLEAGASVQAVTRDPGRARPSWPALPLRPLADLPALLADCDAVLCAAATPAPLLTADLVRRARTGATGRLCVIDVSVPRTVDVALTEAPVDQASDGQIPDVVVLDLDTLARYQPPVPADTRVRAAERFVRQEAEEFLGWRRSRAAGPFIQRLQAAAAARCADSVRRVKPLEPDGADAAVTRATEQVAAALLHGPILAVRDAVAAGDLAAAEALVALFERGVGGQVLPIARGTGASLAGPSAGVRDSGAGQAYLPA
jgi:glutamyl-tRNA reductase